MHTLNVSTGMFTSRQISKGETLTFNIYGTQVTGTVTGFGEHKGRKVIDFKDEAGQDRFAYMNQITQ